MARLRPHWKYPPNCRSLFLHASTSPISIPFPTREDAHLLRNRLYDYRTALRRSTPGTLITTAERVRIRITSTDPDTVTLTLFPRSRSHD